MTDHMTDSMSVKSIFQQMVSSPPMRVAQGTSIGGISEDLKTEKGIKNPTPIQSSPHCVTPSDVKNLPCERNNEEKIQSSHAEGFTNQDKLTIQDQIDAAIVQLNKDWELKLSASLNAMENRILSVLDTRFAKQKSEINELIAASIAAGFTKMYALNNPLKDAEHQKKKELVAKVTESHAIVPVSPNADNQSQDLSLTAPDLSPNVAITQNEANSVELELRRSEDKVDMLRMKSGSIDDEDVQMLEVVGGKKRDVTEVEKESKAVRRSTRKKKQQA